MWIMQMQSESQGILYDPLHLYLNYLVIFYLSQCSKFFVYKSFNACIYFQNYRWNFSYTAQKHSQHLRSPSVTRDVWNRSHSHVRMSQILALPLDWCLNCIMAQTWIHSWNWFLRPSQCSRSQTELKKVCFTKVHLKKMYSINQESC